MADFKESKAPEMPPINLVDPIMRQWLDRVSPKITKDGHTVSMPLVYWPDGSPITYLGLMASEVERENPAAVITVNGKRVVDYDKAMKSSSLNIYSFQYKDDAARALTDGI